MSAVLDELERSLPGPRRARDDVLGEIRDGLADATDAYRADGLSDAEARRRAESDFGDVHAVATDLRAEFAARYGMRSALSMALVFPLLTAMWDLLWLVTDPQPAARNAMPANWPWLASLIDSAAIGASLIALIACAWLALGARRASSPVLAVRAVGVVGTVAIPTIASVSLLMLSAGGSLPSPAGSVLLYLSAAICLWLFHRAGRCFALARRPARPRG